MRVCLAAQCHLARQCCKTAFNQIDRKQQPAIFSDGATSITHQRHDLRRGFAHANTRKDIDRGGPDRVSLLADNGMNRPPSAAMRAEPPEASRSRGCPRPRRERLVVLLSVLWVMEQGQCMGDFWSLAKFTGGLQRACVCQDHAARWVI
jgi:hypothetical protein